MTKRSEVPLRMVDAEAEARFYADVEASILRNRAQGGEPIAHEEVMRRLAKSSARLTGVKLPGQQRMNHVGKKTFAMAHRI